MTEKLYYIDSHLRTFDAEVTAVHPLENGRFAVELDRSAFFPEAGGQTADTGVFWLSDGTSVLVTDVRIDGEGDVVSPDIRVLHFVEMPEGKTLNAGDTVRGEIDWKGRFAKMQNHSAEHIISGLVHTRYGFENVGFHISMEDQEVVFDFSGELTPEEIREVELAANEIVWADKKITTSFPSSSELPGLFYRSKLELTEDVRLVTIEDVDVCACCAPHVNSTGEIGVIKLLDTERYKGGIRIHMKAGAFALADYASRYESTLEASRLLNCPQSEIVPALEKHFSMDDALHEERVALEKALTDARIKEILSSVPDKENAVLLFEEHLDVNGIRRVINETVSAVSLVAVFSGENGNYKYVMGSSRENMSLFAKEMNVALSGRGGGKPEMVQGSVSASKEEIETFFRSACKSGLKTI